MTTMRGRPSIGVVAARSLPPVVALQVFRANRLFGVDSVVPCEWPARITVKFATYLIKVRPQGRPMSIAPEQLWSERFEQIGTLIEGSTEQLTQRWSERAIEEQRDALPAHHKEMRDRLPDLLRAMGRSLASSSNSVPAPHTILALEHGEQRWQIGWKLAEVILDYQILRLVILEFLDDTLDQPLRTREVMAIGLALDEAISASVLSFVGYQERQLREANRRLTDFLPVLGHELRNPLAAVVASMEIVRMCKTRDSVLTEAHEIIERQVDQMTRLLNDMSDVSRIMRGQLDLRPTVIDLRDVVRQAVESLRPLINERNQALTVSLPDAALFVAGDAVRLQQVFSNLLHNAAKYTERGGKIALEAAPQKDRIVVHVRDTGVGIPHSLLPHIFDMFSQGPDHRHQGLGIGLALVRALVEMQAGTVTATSPGPGEGSDFIVDLPQATEDRHQAAEEIAKNHIVKAPCYRILLVDDHVDGGQTLASLLERCGHELKIVEDGIAALSAARTFQPGVVLIDIGLPGMDGYELARALRKEEQFRTTPLVAVTGYANDSDRQRAEQAGFDHHLSKPVELSAVQTLLASLAQRKNDGG
jgi:signal transduction histidine kinase/ActR/RegA family two-component response regulator